MPSSPITNHDTNKEANTLSRSFLKHHPNYPHLLNLSEFELCRFKSETEILRLILYRNKNQHSICQWWWKHASNLVKRCEQVVGLCEEQLELEERGINGGGGKKRVGTKNRGMTVSKRELKRRKKDAKRQEFFEKWEAQKNGGISSTTGFDTHSSPPLKYIPKGTHTRHAKLLALSTFISTTLAPGCFRAFHNVITLGFFVTLGFGLVGALARIWKLLEPIVGQGLGVKAMKAMEKQRLEAEKIGKMDVKMGMKMGVKNGYNNNSSGNHVGDKSVEVYLSLANEDDLGTKVSKEEAQKYLLSLDEEKEQGGRDKKRRAKEASLDEFDQGHATKKMKSRMSSKKTVQSLDTQTSARDDGQDANEPKKKSKKKKNKHDLDSIFDTKQQHVLDDGSKKKKKKTKKNKTDLDAIFGGF